RDRVLRCIEGPAEEARRRQCRSHGASLERPLPARRLPAPIKSREKASRRWLGGDMPIGRADSLILCPIVGDAHCRFGILAQIVLDLLAPGGLQQIVDIGQEIEFFDQPSTSHLILLRVGTPLPSFFPVSSRKASRPRERRDLRVPTSTPSTWAAW